MEPAGLLRDRYRLLGRIGAGGMGTVFLAEDERLPGRRCAAKRALLPPETDPELLQAAKDRFLAEAAMLARLDHAALPKVSDHFEEAGQLWLIMDFVAGQDLAELLREALAHRRQLELDRVIAWAESACDALSYLHGQSPPIVHRDIKPANLKLTPDGQLRLVDFGLAQALEAGEGQTLTVVSGGTSAYQPLEQSGDGSSLDPRADLYALAASLYHLIGGRAPATAQNRFLDAVSMKPLRQLRPDLDTRVAAAIELAMALHPDDRPASADAFKRSLRSWGTEAESEAPWLTALRANALGWMIFIALLLAALALSLG